MIGRWTDAAIDWILLTVACLIHGHQWVWRGRGILACRRCRRVKDVSPPIDTSRWGRA